MEKKSRIKEPKVRKQWIHVYTAHLEDLIAEAIMDCYDEYEQTMGFFCVIEENLKSIKKRL